MVVLTILGLLAICIALAIYKARASGARNARLGAMSDRWLAEQRASHPRD
jgi:hypothetical protein